ncbi:MAG: phosphate ABC transporter ATP-binding protein PstB [Sphingobacteriaceae bacterium]|nr:phosphate ABC transporter ATP-binding protein PstB [Sphingobacteriaceae bacterium]
MVKIESRHLNFWYGNNQVLDNISLQIERNTVTALIGPSGCGKSTFLRLFNRMNELIPESKHRGEVLMDGKDIYQANVDVFELRKKVGMVFQKPNPFPKSIYENVAFGLKIKGINHQVFIKEKVERSLQQVSLWEEVKDKLSKPALALSVGQQQRLCIARALAVEPSILLMDEPTSSLDPLSTAKLEELIRELKAEMTILLVTHNMQQAKRTSDKTAFMYKGNIIEYGKTASFFSNPSNQSTQSYLSGQ